MYNIAVIGCGVIGLTSALAVQKEIGNSAKVTILTREISPNTTGDVAAGMWTPSGLQNTPQDKVDRWAKGTKEYLIKKWKEGKAEEYGISLIPIIKLYADGNFEMPSYVRHSLGYHLYNQRQLEELSKKYKKEVNKAYAFVAFAWEPSKFLPRLQKEFLDNGGSIQIREVRGLEELADFDIIVNCTGLGAKNLLGDMSMKPYRGQVTRVRAPWIFHSQSFFFGGDYYIVPNIENIVLGGTYQEGDFNTCVSDEDKRQIIEECIKFIPALKGTEVIKDSVGLRPGRSEVRLELEICHLNGRDVVVVHNYGHIGCGVTLSVGCAEEVAKLVKECCQKSMLSKL